MEIVRLQELYNLINSYSVSIDEAVDFSYIQTSISKTAIYIQEINKIIAEILIDKMRIEHLVNDKESEYEIRFSDFLINNPDVKAYSTGKERKDYINYLLRELIKETRLLNQEQKDDEALLKLAEKKARDLDRVYPKLKTLWDSIEKELNYLKRIGSDSEYLMKVKNIIDKEAKASTPVFTDDIVEKIDSDKVEKQQVVLDKIIKEESLKQEITPITAKDNTIADLDSLLADL